MKLGFRKLAQYILVNIALGATLLSYTYASNTSKFILENSPIKDIEIVSSTAINVGTSNLLAEENDKIINNVKVYYNPIAEQISVNFKLSKEYNVVIKVMDALGNEVLNLHNANLEAGLQNLNFDTQQKLSEGFYFVRVGAGTESVVKRISVR
ncbi:hypothetical protein GCM10022216_23460 [Sphingobacterium kyonggiense]|uniref:Secretion system C-terminal sorting domain-containing protein n=1 Tax=Sphingobacterium kyonggiense TaxID=714075 RepID=A0ABP7YWH0_9SPHI